MESDFTYMDLALLEAQKALELGNLPIGSVIVLDGRVIGSGHNLVESDKSDLYHAEICAMQSTAAVLFANKGKAEIFSTLEPCAMCFGAILHFRFARLVFAASDSWAGISDKSALPSYYKGRKIEIRKGVREQESSRLIRKYVEQTNCRRHLLQVIP